MTRQRPIVWTIAGSDSGGSAGIQADCRALGALGTHPVTILTAATAQSPEGVRSLGLLTEKQIEDQIASCEKDLPPSSIKTGMLGSPGAVKIVSNALRRIQVPLVCDPVLVASSGSALAAGEMLVALRELLFPLVELLTPNRLEAEKITGMKLQDSTSVTRAGRSILSMGPRSVIIKGGHTEGDLCQDYWTDGKEERWIVSARQRGFRTHGTGCTFSAAVAARLAQGARTPEAVVDAKTYLNASLRRHTLVAQDSAVLPPVSYADYCAQDLPWLPPLASESFARFESTSRFYPIFDRAHWLERAFSQGVKLAQLRIKDLSGEALEREVALSTTLAKSHGAQLFLNDHWELALRHKTFGVHLGQEDLPSADLRALRGAGTRLGISTHCLSELARALSVSPSYVALGPVFPTQAKPMRFGPQGYETLALWRKMISIPLIAIGGITLDDAPSLWRAGADIVSVISDVTKAPDPDARMREWLSLEKTHGSLRSEY